jgi:hypothetical protein
LVSRLGARQRGTAREVLAQAQFIAMLFAIAAFALAQLPESWYFQDSVTPISLSSGYFQ